MQDQRCGGNCCQRTPASQGPFLPSLSSPQPACRPPQPISPSCSRPRQPALLFLARLSFRSLLMDLSFCFCPLFHTFLLFVPFGSPFIKKRPRQTERSAPAWLAGLLPFFRFLLICYLLLGQISSEDSSWSLVILSNSTLSNVCFTVNVYSFAHSLQIHETFSP